MFRPASCIVPLILLMAFALPLQADEAADMTGAELYRTFCASCHGANGRGNGPVARTLRQRVPDLTRIAARNRGVFPADQVRDRIDGQQRPAAHGTTDMPVWGWQFYAYEGEDAVRRARVDDFIRRIVLHVESIQRR